eukprot:1731249-Pyramimonas_sp.AAC.3
MIATLHISLHVHPSRQHPHPALWVPSQAGTPLDSIPTLHFGSHLRLEPRAGSGLWQRLRPPPVGFPLECERPVCGRVALNPVLRLST